MVGNKWQTGNQSSALRSREIPRQSLSSSRCGASPHLLFLLSLPQFLLQIIVLWCGVLLWPVQDICHACVSSQSAAHTKPVCWWVRQGWWRQSGTGGNALALCKHCSAAGKAWVLYQHCFSHKSKIECQVGCYEQCSLQPDHVHVLTTYYDQES